MSTQHHELASGRWNGLSLAEQFGNIGSEVSRALRSQQRNKTERVHGALNRALELFDLTIADPKNKKRLREICRSREVFCDFFYGDNDFQSTGESLDKYFTYFALSARKH